MSGGDPPIVISGGSITIDFDPSAFPPSGDGRHKNPNKKIRRIEVTGDGVDFTHDTPTGKITIKIYYGNP